MRYTVNAPTDSGGRYLGAALMPGLTRPAVGWNSRGRIYGRPGTQKIPANPPEAVSQYYDNMANSGISRSSDAPNFILPALYHEAGSAYGRHEHAPVSVKSDNQMPIPALRPANVIVFDPYRPARIGGQRQVYQPQVVQAWRGMKGTSNG